MTKQERDEFLEEHLDFLKETAEEAKENGFFGDVSELSEQILKTVALLAE